MRSPLPFREIVRVQIRLLVRTTKALRSQGKDDGWGWSRCTYLCYFQVITPQFELFLLFPRVSRAGCKVVGVKKNRKVKSAPIDPYCYPFNVYVSRFW